MLCLFLANHSWHQRLALLLLIASTMFLQACSIPGPHASNEQIASLLRQRIEPRTVGDIAVPAVSYLIASDAIMPRVIYIHGTPGDATGWGDFLVDPVAGLESISVDRPGFGNSGPKNGSCEPRFEVQALALEPLLLERDGQWPVVVGHSLGGPIAARLAAMYPDRVAGLVIVAGSLDPAEEKPSFAQRIATTGLVRAILPRMLDNSMGELAAAKRETTLLAPLLERVGCPTIVIHGDADELVPVANAEYVRRMFTAAARVDVRVIKGQGHFVPWQRPELIRQAVEELWRGEAQ